MTYHILIVEDDPMVRALNAQYVRRILDPAHATIASVGDAKTALTQLKAEPADLLLLDVYMPDMSGSALLQALTAADLHPQVIMLTAASDSEHVQEALAYGVLDYLVKPFSFARFNTAIQRFLTYMRVTTQHDTFSQPQLDRLFATAPSQSSAQLPKGLSSYTMTNIQKVIEQVPHPFSNQDIANAAKLSRISTKKYLDYLVAHDQLTATIKYQKVGRPITLYRPVD